jgi:hypothetical protein
LYSSLLDAPLFLFADMLASIYATTPSSNTVRFDHPSPGNHSIATMNSVGSRSRSARNVMARTLPILERGGSTRNFRELPAGDRRRNAMTMMESPGSTRNMRALPDRRVPGHRSNSTRRFFVHDQASRSSGTSGSQTTASSLSSQFRRIQLERTDSASSMGSVASWGSGGVGDSSLNTGGSNTYNDSILSILSMESLTTTGTATTPGGRLPSHCSHSGDTSDTDDMMSLFSKDSVRVRQNQMEQSVSSFFSKDSKDSARVRQNPMEQSVSSLSLSAHAAHAVAAVFRGEDDMLSMTSETTIYSFDQSARPLRMINATAGRAHEWS